MSIKQYAKRAKKRLQEGFWSDIMLQREKEREVAAAQGRNSYPAMIEQKERLRKRLYCPEYDADAAFERKVIALLEKETLPANPIAHLADKKAMEQMSPAAKQAYLLKLSARYRQIAERYYRAEQP